MPYEGCTACTSSLGFPQTKAATETKPLRKTTIKLFEQNLGKIKDRKKTRFKTIIDNPQETKKKGGSVNKAVGWSQLNGIQLDEVKLQD